MLALAVALSLTLAQPVDSPAPSPPAPSTPPVSATSAPGPAFPRSGFNPGGPMIPYPAGRMPPSALHVVPGDVVIRNSGSTNMGGYVVVVHSDDSADVSSGGAITHKDVGAPQAAWLRDLIAAIPLDQLPGGHCMKSASFGSSTTVTTNGVTSPDLSCPGTPHERELMRTVGVIVNQLGVTPLGGRPRIHLL